MSHARWLALALLCGSLLGCTLPVVAQTSNTSQDDPPGDVALRLAPDSGGPSRPAPDGMDADLLDLRQLWIGGETDLDFQIGIRLARLPDGFPTPQRTVTFRREDVTYRIVAPAPGQLDPNRGQLQSFDEGAGRFRAIELLATSVDRATNQITFTLPRDLVTDARHAPTRFGDTIEKAFAGTRRSLAGLQGSPTGDPTGGIFLEDRAPDAGFLPVYTMQKARFSQGPVLLRSDDPIRVSNGGMGTIVYAVNLTNQGSSGQDFQLAAIDLPEGWTVRVPSFLHAAAGESVAFPVIVAMPATHEHGLQRTFEVKATSASSPETWARVQLGVWWMQTPQPAGHHPTLRLHSRPVDFDSPIGILHPLRSTWMNPSTDDPEPGTDDGDVESLANDEFADLVFGQKAPSGEEWTTEWWFPLSPSLRIGLDFRPGEPMLLSAKARHPVGAQTTRVGATLFYCDPSVADANCATSRPSSAPAAWKQIATGTSEPQPAAAGEVVSFGVAAPVDAVAELIPHERAANLGLSIVLRTSVPQNTILLPPRPALVIKSGEWRSSLVLPLDEYHDPVEEAFEQVGTLALVRLDGDERPVNAGEGLRFRFALENRGTGTQPLRAELHGANREWARLLSAPEFDLRAGATAEIAVYVEAPADAAEGQRADLILVAQNRDDARSVAATPFRTVVVTRDLPNEPSSLREVGEPTPLPSLVLVVAAVLVAAASRRRF